MTSFGELFAGVEDDNPFYPGSKERRDTRPQPPENDVDPFSGVTPRSYQVGPDLVQFFTIGQLAKALGRSAVTLRKWERDGVIPKATFVAPNPSKDPRAKRRLYSRDQAEGVVRIADSECIPPFGTVLISESKFSERVIALFKELKGK